MLYVIYGVIMARKLKPVEEAARLYQTPILLRVDSTVYLVNATHAGRELPTDNRRFFAMLEFASGFRKIEKASVDKLPVSIEPAKERGVVASLEKSSVPVSGNPVRQAIRAGKMFGTEAKIIVMRTFDELTKVLEPLKAVPTLTVQKKI